MNGNGVRHELDHSRVARGDEDIVWSEPQREASLFPYLLKARHQLNCDHLLSTVVVGFDNYRFQFVGLERLVVRDALVS